MWVGVAVIKGLCWNVAMVTSHNIASFGGYILYSVTEHMYALALLGSLIKTNIHS